MVLKIVKFLYGIVKAEFNFLKLFIIRILVIVTQVFPETPRGCRIRGYIYKPFLNSCGKNFQVAIGVKLEHLYNIVIGDNVFIGPACWICGVRGGITLDNEVMLGPKISMSSSNHTILDNSYRFGPGIGSPIFVGSGTWIGANSVITAGVSIGKCCLIAAGSVVTKNFDSNCIVAGVPAMIIKKNLK